MSVRKKCIRRHGLDSDVVHIIREKLLIRRAWFDIIQHRFPVAFYIAKPKSNINLVCVERDGSNRKELNTNVIRTNETPSEFLWTGPVKRRSSEWQNRPSTEGGELARYQTVIRNYRS